MEIVEAIQLAEQGKSGLTPAVIKGLKGMSSPHIWHLLNNLVQGPYLEVGVWKGSTLTAALTGKDMPAWAIDNFSQFGDVRDEFKANTAHLNFNFIEGDCFGADTIFPIPGGIEYYLYDGDHSMGSHYLALASYIERMAQEFIYMVDDWNVAEVQAGTETAIKDLGLSVMERHAMFTPKNGCRDSWWNGFAVFKLRK